jgi:isopentenyl-diphosphate delta-isomerase
MSIDEKVDIVNENDEVVGVVSKQIAHRDGLLHRTVIAEVIGSDGSWTLVKQASDRQDAGQFVSPIGGHVQSNESVEDALRREGNEEYGLEGDISFKYIGKKIYRREVNGKKEHHYFILFEIYSDKAPILNEESIGYEKFTKEQLYREVEKNPKKFGDAFHFVLETFYPHLLAKNGS